MIKKTAVETKVLVFLLVCSGYFFGFVGLARAAILKEINFQGKMVNANGTNVTDGNYDMEFKIYTVSSGGAAVWTETRTTVNQVAVADGIFRVSLGSVTTLPGSIDFTADSLYLGVNFNGDGEMTPRIRLAAVPYAFFANQAQGLTANGSDDIVASLDADTNFQITGGAASGVDMVVLSNSGQGTITNGVDGLSIDFTAATGGSGETNAGAHIAITDSGDASDTISGLQITAGTASAGTQYGINIEGITGGGGTEYALVIGTGWDRGLSVSSASTFTAALTSEAALTIGTAGNTLTLDPASGLTYAGTARPAKKITISPEYSGGTLTAFYGAGTDTNITGTMTADVETSAANELRTYYSWTRTTDATQHYYTIAVRVILPADFAAWATSNALQVEYVTGSATNTVSDLDVRVYLESDATTAVASSADNASTSWTAVTIDDSVLDDASAPEWDAAGETAVIYLRMGSASSNAVKVGDIVLNYLAAF